MGMSKDKVQLKKDIKRFKKLLISKAKKKGLYENFGQRESSKLRDKYDFWDGEIGDLIQGFDEWARNVNDGDLK
jgi:hypothetical protein